MRSDSLSARRLRGAGIVALAAVGAVVGYRLSPAHADAAPQPSEQAPRQIAFSGYAEFNGVPLDGVRRVRHSVWATAGQPGLPSDSLFREEKDERFVAGRFTATLGDCANCTNGRGSPVTLESAIAGLSKVFVSTQLCTGQGFNASCNVLDAFVPGETIEVATSAFGLATPSQRLIGVWQSAPEVGCTIAGPSATPVPQLRVAVNLPQTSRLEISYAAAASWRVGYNSSTSGLQVAVGPATQSTDWSTGSPRLVWSVSPWPQSRIGRSATSLLRRSATTPVNGAFAAQTFAVSGVAPGAYTIMLTANTVGTGDGEVDVCGRGSSARTMQEDSVLTVLAFAE
jgi:hypothetical protein